MSDWMGDWFEDMEGLVGDMFLHEEESLKKEEEITSQEDEILSDLLNEIDEDDLY
jgi:hypothetical protein